jgi:hypothetical protein
MIKDWPQLKELALSLDLPEVTFARPWGHETLKVFGKSWVYWAAKVDAAVFRCDVDEREALVQADPDTFLTHPHYTPHALILVAAGRIDPDWARARLIRTWRDAAPKRFLRVWDATRAAP